MTGWGDIREDRKIRGFEVLRRRELLSDSFELISFIDKF